MRKRVTTRTSERLCRAAYDYEWLASVFRKEGHNEYAETLAKVSSLLGQCGRSLERKLMGMEG